MTQRRGKLTVDQVALIKAAPEETTNSALADEFEVSPQAISMIRRGVMHAKAERLTPDEVEVEIQRIVGVPDMTLMRAKAADEIMQCVLLCLDDLKRTKDPANREKRVAILAGALRDVAEATTVLKSPATLGEMTDDEIIAALKTRETPKTIGPKTQTQEKVQ